MDTRNEKKRAESSKMAKFEAPDITGWIFSGAWIFKKLQSFVKKKVTGEQFLLTSIIFHMNLLNFPKIQTTIKTHSLMLGAIRFY